MTKGLDQVFGLPPMEELFDEQPPKEEEEDTGKEVATSMDDHGKAMDKIHDEMLKHAQDIAELAYDLDPARAPRMLEVGAMYYKGAIDAKNSKKDAELKLITLMQNERKLRLEEMKAKGVGGVLPSDDAKVIMVEDRNTLLKRLREEALKSNESDKG